jgi:hypothetical protein
MMLITLKIKLKKEYSFHVGIRKSFIIFIIKPLLIKHIPVYILILIFSPNKVHRKIGINELLKF